MATLFYYVQHGSTTDADFVTPPPSTSNAEPFSILNDSGSFSLRTKVDGVSFELETFTVALQTEANGGIQKGSTGIFLQETLFFLMKHVHVCCLRVCTFRNRDTHHI